LVHPYQLFQDAAFGKVVLMDYFCLRVRKSFKTHGFRLRCLYLIKYVFMQDAEKELRGYYNSNIETLAGKICTLMRKRRGFVIGEVITFLAAVAFVVCYFAVSAAGYWWLLVFLSLASYMTVRHFDEKNDEEIDHLTALKHVSEKELEALGGNFSVFGSGEKYIDVHHEYCFDLDVFGKDSLFNRINRTITSGGSDTLSGFLSDVGKNIDSQCRNPEIILRQIAVEELSAKKDWRISFLALGDKEQIESKRILDVLKKVTDMKISSFASSPFALGIAVLALVGFYGSIAACAFGMVSFQLPLWWGLIQFFLVVALNSRSLNKVEKAVGDLHEQIKSFIRLIELILDEDFAAEVNVRQKKTLDGSMESVAKLDKIFRGLDRRDSFLGIVLFNMFGLADFFLTRRFIAWQADYLDYMQKWINAVSSMDAMVSMGTMHFNNPEAVFPEIVENREIVYEAENLWHPFLGAGAKKNNFEINDHSYYIITGANMAGKSTFLRALGVNYILAMCGMPVFASCFRTGCFKLFSSMRTQDDLTHGISYFNAELLRLKQLIEYVEDDEIPTLIILDEILKGTNSADKLSGSRMFLEAMAGKNAAGVIATHDLELAKMSEEYPERFHNFCFEIKIGERVTYDYRISEGVARNQNATFLLKGILKNH